MTARRFRMLHGILPGVLLLSAIAASLATGFDPWLADHAFFDGHRWIGADTWWAKDLIHTGGRDFVRFVALGALIGLLASFVNPRFRQWRKGAAFVFAGIALSTALVGELKSVTNVDCPWSLQRYGGPYPHIGLFEDRPDALPRAKCFPGAHSSSAFALMCFYFLWRTRRPRAAKAALIGAIGLGVIFSFGQQARGAHFVSHDLTSALIVWYVLLGLAAAFRVIPAASSSADR